MRVAQTGVGKLNNYFEPKSFQVILKSYLSELKRGLRRAQVHIVDRYEWFRVMYRPQTYLRLYTSTIQEILTYDPLATRNKGKPLLA